MDFCHTGVDINIFAIVIIIKSECMIADIIVDVFFLVKGKLEGTSHCTSQS